MNYLEKLKSKFEQLSMSGHSGSAQPSGNSGGYPGGSYNARQQQQPMYPPSHWQAPQPPNQGYPPPHPGGPGGFYAPPPGMQPYGYGPPGGQGYPPPNQAPMFYPQDGANTQAYPPTQHGEQLPMVPPRPPRAGPEPTSSYPPSGMAATTEQQGEGKLDRSASAEVPAGVPLPLDQHDIYPADADGNRKHISGNQEGSMLFLNVKESEMVHQRFLVVYGQVPGVKGANDRIVVRHPYFPPLSFPAVDGYFKVLAELENGDNALRFEYLQGNNCIATGTLNIKMSPYLEKPPLILAVVLGRDSQGEFDAPPNARGPGRNDLDAAIRKFRCCAYLWQAFVAEQLHRQGFGRRTFRLEESYEPDTMARDNMNRMTAKVHVIRSRRTVAEIRDKERAQQWCPPPGYKRHTTESQFSLANEAIDDYGVFKGKHFIVCLSLDAHWDPQLQVILGHAALGGGTGTRRLGVFGSHTTHAWPANAEEIAEKFLDTTKTDTRYLANDAKECGEYWRAANIGMGAFLHECGHLLTLAHTPSGIMSRGFNDFNRTFMAHAPNFQGPVRQRDEAGAHWHRTDIIRLRHHVLLRLPSDPPLRENEQNEAGFELLAIEEGLLVRSQSGITMIEVWVNGHYRNHIEYTSENLPRRRNGSIMADRAEMATAYPQQVFISEAKLHMVAGNWSRSDKVNLVLTSRAMATETFENVLDPVTLNARRDQDGNQIFSANKLGKGEMQGTVYSDARFSAKSIRSSMPKLQRIEIRSGNYIDGIIFHMDNGSRAQIGQCAGGGKSEMVISPDDDLSHIVVRCGWWIDGMEFFTAKGQRSGWKGGHSGDQRVLQPPAGYGFMGLSGSGAKWLDSLTMHYARCR
ncbi:hypothetical protein IWW42_005623 [Coemansia sp. RSA 1085]|nr:hypothetical protein IWW42_005623 [Coemansia sp. RSA 1085]